MRHILLAAFLVGCGADSVTGSDETVSQSEQAATVCGVGPTVKGIDVSYYQGTIDWTAVKNDGVKYAFIRASDGLNTIDTKFAANWSGSRAAGVKHGAYQFFRPSQDPIAQADLLLQKIGGKLQADDLPPVIDVEASDGVAAATIAANVKKWMAHVKAAIGRDPIVYTGLYFWRDSVGDPDVKPAKLWHAQYTTAACPTIAPSFNDWALWQYADNGTVAGISGGVDMDRWNGDMASLTAFLGPASKCGNNTCEAAESPLDCPADCGPCATIDATGGTVDDGDACFEGGGPEVSMRHVTSAGDEGDLVWTHTTEDTVEGNFGTWYLWFAEAGSYKVEVYTAAAFAQSKQAKYSVEAGADKKTVTIDQTAVDGWQTLGEFTFDAGKYQRVHLADNTGEPLANSVQMVFDAVRVTRVGDVPPDSGSGSDDMPPGDQSSGCSAGGSSGMGAGLLLALGLVLRRRRR